ncbi:transglycosylase SLT domain-containing protein, partial [Streptomyces sp. S9]|nr:transglycosylase SLT domain-containing protein [Streptomyces sp. S9]
ARPPTRLVQGEIYSYVQDGVRHYVSKRPKGLASATQVRTIRYSFIETCFACAAQPGVNFGTLRLNTVAYASEIAAAARQHGVEEAIVRAIIHAESAYNPTALSRVGAQGLMQL